MRIARIDVYGYELRYAHGDYVMSGGRSVSSLPSTVVRVETDDAVVGWGETCPLGPTYLEAHAEGARAALRELLPALVGVEVANVEAVMEHALRGHAYAKAAVDIACWDVLGRALGVPVSTLLGGVRSPDFPLYVAIPLGPSRRWSRTCASCAPVSRFQLKLGADPVEDAARVRAVLDATDRRARHRRRQRRLAAARCRRRGAGAGGPGPRAVRAALPDARGVPGRA